MRTAKFAGVLALAIVSASMLSAEVMRKAVGQQIAPGTQTRAAADPGVPDETRVAALADQTGRAAAAPQDPQPTRTASPILRATAARSSRL
ncbi:MAG: hypothetical protein ACXW3X_12785 [Rhodoplanes sp.]